METLSYRTPGGVAPEGLPRIGFIGHPYDRLLCLDTFCADLFRLRECCVYFTEDMTAPLTAEQKQAMAGMALCLLPVSPTLLASSCRAVEEDLPLFRSLGIKVLAVMIGPGLLPRIKEDDRFHGLTVLDYGGTPAATSLYREKLKRILFDALGEVPDQPRFTREALQFLEERRASPEPETETITESSLLAELEQLEAWVEEHPEAEAREALQDWLAVSADFARRGLGNDPAAQDYLLGRAWLVGIFQEANREQGIGLITDAAEAGLSEAIHWLAELYLDPEAPERDIGTALHWERRYADALSRAYGEDDPKAIREKHALSKLCLVAGEAGEALRILEELYPISLRVLGESHSQTVSIVGELAVSCHELGDDESALAWREKQCWLLRDRGEELREAQEALLDAYRALQMNHYRRYLADRSDLEPLRQRRKLFSKAVRLCEELGDKPRRRSLLGSLADDLCLLGETEEAKKIMVSLLREDPEDFRSTVTLAGIYRIQGKYREADIAMERAIVIYSREHDCDGVEIALREELAELRRKQRETTVTLTSRSN